MKNLKKKIAIIIFKQKILNNSFIFLIPRIALRLFSKSLLMMSHGIKYVFLKNDILNLKASNILYMPITSKLEFLKIISQYKKMFFGFKFKNLFFPFNSLQKFNYLQFFSVNNFILNLRIFYFFFLKYILVLKRKILKF